MSENLHDIDKLFLDSIEGHEETPPGKLWDEIDHRLDKKNIAQSKRKYNKLKLFSAALLLLLLSVIVYQLVTGKQGEASTANGITVKRNTTSGAHENTSVAAIKKDNGKVTAAPETLNAASESGTGTTKGRGSTQTAPRNNPAAAAGPPDQSSTAIASVAGDSYNGEKINPLNKSITKAAAANKAIDVGKAAASASGAPPAVAPLLSEKATAAEHLLENSSNAVNTSKPAILHVLRPSRQRAMVFNHISKSRFTRNYQRNQQAVAGSRTANGKKHSRREPKAAAEVDNNTAAANTGVNNQQQSAVANKADPATSKAARSLTGVQIADYTAMQVIVPSAGEISSNTLPGIVLPYDAATTAITKKSTGFHFSIMPFFSRQFSFDRIVQDQDHIRPPQQGPNDRDRIKNDETYTAYSSGGLLVEIPLRKKWSLQTGLGLNTRSVTIQPKKLYAQMDNDGKIKYRFDCSSGYTFLSPKTGTAPVLGDSITVAASKNSLQYIGVPLTLTYTFLNAKKINIIPSVGLMANFLVKQRIETSLNQGATSQKENITTIQGLRRTYFNAMAGIALQYNFSRRISLNMIPAANIAVSSINNTAAVKSYPNSFSITGGINIHF